MVACLSVPPSGAHTLDQTQVFRDVIEVDGRAVRDREDKPGDDRLEVKSTYTNFRRFQVTVDEQIKVPR